MPQEKSAGVLLYCGSREQPEFLVLHYGAGHWSFPKGHVEQSEGEQQAALRELVEETGVSGKQIQLLEGFREEIEYFFKRAGITVHKTVVFFLAHAPRKPRVKLSFEHKGFAWLAFEQALERLTYKTDKQVLEKAMAFLRATKPVVQKKLAYSKT